jgi:hypothetical protein
MATALDGTTTGLLTQVRPGTAFILTLTGDLKTIPTSRITSIKALKVQGNPASVAPALRLFAGFVLGLNEYQNNVTVC